MKLSDALKQVTPFNRCAAFRCPPKKKPFNYGCYLHGDELFVVRRDGSVVADCHTKYETFGSEHDDWEVLEFTK